MSETLTDSDRIDEVIAERYPYPLVATYARALLQAADATEAHEFLLDLSEATLKYLAVIAIAQYLRDGAGDAVINRSLKDLQRPSLGHWAGWLRELSRHYQRDQRPLLAQLVSAYGTRHGGAVLTAAQGLSRVSASLGSGAPVIAADTVTTQQFFDTLVGYRNRLAHGARPSGYDRASVTELLAPALRELYATLDFLARFRLAYVRSVSVDFSTPDRGAKHRYRHLVTFLVGASPRASATPFVGDEPFPDKQLYVLDERGDFTPLLSVHPFMVFTHCASCNRDQAFVLNATTTTAQDYLAYQCTHHVRPSEFFAYMQRLLQQLDGSASAWDEDQRTTRWELLKTAPPSLPASPAALTMRGAGSEVVVRDGRALSVGRDAGNDLRYDDIRVSRRHLAVHCEDGVWRLEDSGSHNGTFLDGARITAIVLQGAQTFTLGGADGPALHTAIGDAAPPSPQAPPAPPAVNGAPPAPTGDVTGPPQAAVVSVGRAPSNDVVIPDPTVSRQHAELRRSASGGYEIRDLGSHNGTYVNGRYITASPLSEADVVSIGRTRLRLRGATLVVVPAEDTSLEVVDVSVMTPDRRTLLSHVSLALEDHCFLGIVGPSGAGKTTLVNAMTGFRPADTGAVYYGGRNLYAEYDDLRHGIGYVPQDDIIHTQLTVRQALEFTAELRFPPDVTAAERRTRVEEVMQELGLSERAGLVIEKLSGGQRKRANIGVELLTKPSPLFLDEPTSGLDPGLEKGVMTLLRGLADGGRTIIIVTHSQQSLDLCDRLLVLAPGGRVAYFGPPKGALPFFGRSDLADVFTDLEQHPETAWDDRYRASEECRAYVESPLSRRAAVSTTVQPRALPPRAPGVWRRQTWTLLRRYAVAMAADRRNLALILLQAPVLAVLMIAALGANSFTSPNVYAQMVVTVSVLTVTLTGLLNSIREIVKEFPIYQRERFVGLSLRAYLLSKLGVLAPLTVAQAVVLVLIGLVRQPVPSSAPVVGSPTLALIIDVALAGLAAMSLGLMVSAMMRSADKAISVLILIVVAQLVMSIPLLDVGSKPVLGQLSWFSSAKWGVDAVGSTANLNAIQPPLGGPDASWDHTAGAWLGDIVVLLVLVLAGVAITAWLLKRRDPKLLARSG